MLTLPVEQTEEEIAPSPGENQAKPPHVLLGCSRAEPAAFPPLQPSEHPAGLEIFAQPRLPPAWPSRPPAPCSSRKPPNLTAAGSEGPLGPLYVSRIPAQGVGSPVFPARN